MKFVIDTHCLVWYLQDHPRLPNTARTLIDATQSSPHIIIPTIVTAELLYISHRLKRVMLFTELLDHLEDDGRFQFADLTTDILRHAAPLRHLEMHDALIIATALAWSAPLMTVDAEIIAAKRVAIVRLT